MSDSDKILLQLLLDVRLFGGELQALLGPAASAEADCAPYKAKSIMAKASVSTFGGLRGAISLALVLIIEKHLNDPDSDAEDGDTSRYFDAEHGRKAMVIICCCVFMTIVINGSLAGLFFQKLYGSRLSSDVDEIIFHYVEKRIRRKARDFISHTDVLPPFDAEEVKKLCHCFDYHFSTVERTAA